MESLENAHMESQSGSCPQTRSRFQHGKFQMKESDRKSSIGCLLTMADTQHRHRSDGERSVLGRRLALLYIQSTPLFRRRRADLSLLPRKTRPHRWLTVHFRALELGPSSPLCASPVCIIVRHSSVQNSPQTPPIMISATSSTKQ